MLGRTVEMLRQRHRLLISIPFKAAAEVMCSLIFATLQLRALLEILL